MSVTYGGTTGSDSNHSGNDSGVATFCDVSPAARIKVDGTLTQIRVQMWASRTEIPFTNAGVSVWRDTGDSLDASTFVSSSTLPSVAHNTVTDLDTPLQVQAGDAVAIYWNTVDARISIYNNAALALQYQMSAKTTSGAWGNYLAAYGVRMELFGTVPNIILIGDSITAGHGPAAAWASWHDNVTWYSTGYKNVLCNPAYLLRNLLGSSNLIYNLGTGASTAADGVAAWSTYVTPYKTAGGIVLANYGRNDCGGSVYDVATYLGYWDQLLAKAVADSLTLVRGSIPHVGTGYTYGGHDATYWNAMFDTWNAAAVVWCKINGVKNIDVANIIGTEYVSDNHPTQIGHGRLAIGNASGLLRNAVEFPDVANVLTTDTVNSVTGTYVVPVQGQVLAPASGGTTYGAASGTTGTYTPAGSTYVLTTAPDYGIGGTGGAKTATLPATTVVLTAAWGGPSAYGVGGTGSTPQATLPQTGDVRYGAAAYGKYGFTFTPSCHVPISNQVLFGIAVDVEEAGTVSLPNNNSPSATGDVSLVKSGMKFGAGNLQVGTYPTTETTIAAITWPDLDEVDGGVLFGPTTGEEYEGTGVNATTILTALGLATGNLDTQLGLLATADVQPDYKPVVSEAGNVAADVKLVKTVDADTAIAARVDASTLAGKFAGITLVAKWLRGLFRKDAMDATAKAEVNLTGGTFDEATDSNQGVRDTLPAATQSASSFTGAFPAGVLINAPTGATASYTVSSAAVGEAPIVDIVQYQYAAFGPVSITAESSQAGDSHSLLVYAIGSPSTVLWSLTTAASEISVGGTDNKTITLTDTDAHTSTAGTWAYVLRNTTDDTVVCEGSLTIKDVPNVPV